MAQPALIPAGEQHAQLVSDLRRAPALRHQPVNGLGQHPIERDPPLAGLVRPEPRGMLGMVRAIAPVRVAVAADLTADSRWGASQLPGDTADGHVLGEQVGDLSPFLLERYRALRGLGSMIFTGG